MERRYWYSLRSYTFLNLPYVHATTAGGDDDDDRRASQLYAYVRKGTANGRTCCNLHGLHNKNGVGSNSTRREVYRELLDMMMIVPVPRAHLLNTDPLRTALVVMVTMLATANAWSWSRVTMAPCSATDPAQWFDIASPSGSPTEIRHRSTDRCVAVRDCDYSYKQGVVSYGQIVVDRCDAVSSCSHWTGVADPTAPEKSMFKAEHTVPPYFSLNAVGTPDGMIANPAAVSIILPSEMAKVRSAVWVVAYGGDAWFNGANNQWQFLPATGQLRLTSAADLMLYTICKGHGTDCCMVVEPCNFPCMLISSGWAVVLLLTLSTVGYLILGAAYAIKIQGKTVAKDGWPGLVQHRTHWAQLIALVRDGIGYSRTRLRGEQVHRPATAGLEGRQVTARTTSASDGSPTKWKSKKNAKAGEKEKESSNRAGGTGHAGRVEPAPVPNVSDMAKQTLAGGGGKWVQIPA